MTVYEPSASRHTILRLTWAVKLVSGARIALGALTLLNVSASAQEIDLPRRAPLVVSEVSVIDPASGTVTAATTVVIAEERIVSVGDSAGDLPEGAEIIDGRGKYLMPGLWDMHVHLSYARASALPALVANGVTGVRDMGSDLAEIDEWRVQIAAGLRVGPTIIRAGPMLNGMEFNIYQLAIADATEAQTAVRALQKIGVDFIKLHRRTSREAYLGIADAARELGLRFAGHIPMSVSPAEASDAGQTSIEHVDTLFEGTFATQNAGRNLAEAIREWRATEARELFTTFASNGTMVAPTLIAQGHLLRWLETGEPDPRMRYIARSAREQADEALSTIMPQAEDFVRERSPVFQELQAVVGLMSRAGVKLLAGSDLSYLHPPGFSLHDELELLVQSGVSIEDALRAATTNPAAWLGSPNIGSVAPSQRADLVLLDANPFDAIRNTRRIRGVVFRGEYLDRQSLDELLLEVERLAETE